MARRYDSFFAIDWCDLENVLECNLVRFRASTRDLNTIILGRDCDRKFVN